MSSAPGWSLPVPLVTTLEARPEAVFFASAGAWATSGGAGIGGAVGATAAEVAGAVLVGGTATTDALGGTSTGLLEARVSVEVGEGAGSHATSRANPRRAGRARGDSMAAAI